MDNTSGLSLANGFMTGMNFMDRHFANKESRARSNARFEHEQDGWEREDNARLISAFQAGIKSGHVDPNIAGEYGRRFDVDWSNYVNPEFGNALDVLEQTVQGKYSMKSPEFKNAFSRVFQREIQKNTGEQTDNGTITKKRLNGVYPSPDGQGIMVDLDVFEEGPGGGAWRSAPVTDNRSASDSSVKTVSLDEAIKQLRGHRLMYQGIQNSPQLQALIKQQAALNGLQLSEPKPGYSEVTKHPELGHIQTGPDGQVNVIQGLQTPKPQFSAPYEHPELGWVQKGPDGKVTPYKLGNDNAGQYGEVINHPELGLVQKGPNGKYVQFKVDGGKTGGKSLDASVMTQIQQTARNFHGKFNPDGSFLGLPKDSRQKYALAMQRTEELVGAGYPIFEAANLANLSVADPLTLEAARELAEREAKEADLGWGEEDAFIEKRSQELMIQQNQAIQLYEQFKSGKQAPGLNMPSPASQQQSVQGLTKPSMQAPVVPEGQSGTIQRTQTRQAKPADVEKLKAYLSQAKTPEQVQKLKQYYIKNFGQLPEGI